MNTALATNRKAGNGYPVINVDVLVTQVQQECPEKAGITYQKTKLLSPEMLRNNG